MMEQWLAMEHYRLHAVEEWPDGPRKRAALGAIYSKMESLSRNQPSTSAECVICLNRLKKLVEFPRRSSPSTLVGAAA